MIKKAALVVAMLASATSVNTYAAVENEVPVRYDVLVTARLSCQKSVLDASPGKKDEVTDLLVGTSQASLAKRIGQQAASYAVRLGSSKRDLVLRDQTVMHPQPGKDFSDDVVAPVCSRYISSDADFNKRYPDVSSATQPAGQTATKISGGTVGPCATNVECVKTMLVSAKAEDMTSVLEAAKTIDGFPRPTRGNRPTARKLNEEGLNALDASKPDEAIRLFSQATQADPSDQEIISNLAYAYAQSGQLAKSEDTAVLALSLNPRRTSVWAPLATTLAKEHRYDQALEAMWLAYQFSGDKAKTLIFIDSKLASESNPDAIKLYTASKTWFEKNEKPALLQWPK